MTQTSPMGQPAGNTLRICSWNCKGLNHPIKRSKVLHHLRHLGAQIAFLQETHLKVSDHYRLRRGWVGQLYHSTFHSKARGAAILIHKSVPFVSSSIIVDPNGRYAIVTGHIHSTRLILANIYAPNWDDANFFRNLFARIPDMSSHLPVLRGDFNCWLGSLDRSSTKPTTPSNLLKLLETYYSQSPIPGASLTPQIGNILTSHLFAILTPALTIYS